MMGSFPGDGLDANRGASVGADASAGGDPIDDLLVRSGARRVDPERVARLPGAVVVAGACTDQASTRSELGQHLTAARVVVGVVDLDPLQTSLGQLGERIAGEHVLGTRSPWVR